MVKTTSIGIENLCVPCHASCKYCLLSSCQHATGVDYERGKRFARRLHEELTAVRPDLRFFHYIGYCMDTPDLADYIRFSQEIGSPSAEFLQFNGLRVRNEEETVQLMQTIHGEGIREIDLTFYGTRDYHDRFAGRTGDFEFLLRILNAANQVGQTVGVSFPLTRENMTQVDALMDLLSRYSLSRFSIFLPHSKGRGWMLNEQRLTKADFESLSQRVTDHFSKIKHQTEGEWIKENDWPKAETRTLTICLTPDNIDYLEAMSAEKIICELEALDDAYYEQMPAIADLARMYGDQEGQQLFRIRDLHLKWQQMYLRDYGNGIYDINDEGHHFSVRF